MPITATGATVTGGTFSMLHTYDSSDSINKIFDCTDDDYISNLTEGLTKGNEYPFARSITSPGLLDLREQIGIYVVYLFVNCVLSFLNLLLFALLSIPCLLPLFLLT